MHLPLHTIKSPRLVPLGIADLIFSDHLKKVPWPIRLAIVDRISDPAQTQESIKAPTSQDKLMAVASP